MNKLENISSEEKTLTSSREVFFNPYNPIFVKVTNDALQHPS